MAAKKRLNPLQRALAQADAITAANNELERLSRPTVAASQPTMQPPDDVHRDRRNWSVPSSTDTDYAARLNAHNDAVRAKRRAAMEERRRGKG